MFESFILEVRGKQPAFDVDLEHKRCKDVIRDIYNEFARRLASIYSTAIHFRRRTVIREVGKCKAVEQALIEAYHTIDF